MALTATWSVTGLWTTWHASSDLSVPLGRVPMLRLLGGNGETTSRLPSCYSSPLRSACGRRDGLKARGTFNSGNTAS